jgi:hypothetical protein
MQYGGLGRFLATIILLVVTNLGVAQADLYLHEVRSRIDHEVQVPANDLRANSNRPAYTEMDMLDAMEVFRYQLHSDLQAAQVVEPHVAHIKVEDLEIIKVKRDPSGKVVSIKARVDMRGYFISESPAQALPQEQYRFIRTKNVNHITVEVVLREGNDRKSFFFELDEKSVEQWMDNGQFSFTSLHLEDIKYDKLRAEIAQWLSGRRTIFVKTEGFIHLESPERENVIPFDAKSLFKDLKLTGMGSIWQDVKVACRRFLE